MNLVTKSYTRQSVGVLINFNCISINIVYVFVFVHLKNNLLWCCCFRILQQQQEAEEANRLLNERLQHEELMKSQDYMYGT